MRSQAPVRTGTRPLKPAPLPESVDVAAARDPIHVLPGLDPTQALTHDFLEVCVVGVESPQVLSNSAISFLELKSHRFRPCLLMLQVAQMKHTAAAKYGEQGADRQQNECADDYAFVFPRKCR